jgi:hypothetical protein
VTISQKTELRDMEDTILEAEGRADERIAASEVLEVKLDGEFLMSSLVDEAETALATEALQTASPPAWRLPPLGRCRADMFDVKRSNSNERSVCGVSSVELQMQVRYDR